MSEPFVAGVLRRLTEVVIRGGSSHHQPHHAAFLADIAEREAPTTSSAEARAAWQHLRAAVADARHTPLLGMVAVVCIAFAVLLSMVVPAPRRLDREPFESELQQLCQTVSIMLTVIAVRRAHRRGARALMSVSLAGLAVGALWYLRIDYERTSRLVAFVDQVLVVAQIAAFAGSMVALVALATRSRLFAAGWRALAVGALLYAVANAVDSFAFARAGDTLWVLLVCMPMIGLVAFAAFLLFQVPPLWQRAR